MNENIIAAIKNRRTYYAISDRSPISDVEIENILGMALSYVPSAFNSQSARMVLLLGNEHRACWEIVKSTLKKIVPEANFPKTEAKIDRSFLAGYGTVLFFEDQSVIEAMQEQFPSYSANFPIWSDHSSGMHQFAVWMVLESVGFGASLQHYNPLIDEAVKERWKIDPKWKLVAQMPFGVPIEQPGDKEMKPLKERLLTFR